MNRTIADDGNPCCIDQAPSTEDKCGDESRFAQIKVNRKVIRDSEILTSYTVEFMDTLGNPCELSAIKPKSGNETTYMLYKVKEDEKLGLIEGEVITLLQNDFQTSVSTLYYSEDVLYEPPWKVEHSFSIDGNAFKLIIDLDTNYFMLEKVGNREADAFSDKLAAYIVIRMLEIESNNKE